MESNYLRYFLRSMCDKVIVAVRALSALLVLIFGLIEDHNIGDICATAAAAATSLTGAPTTPTTTTLLSTTTS